MITFKRQRLWNTVQKHLCVARCHIIWFCRLLSVGKKMERVKFAFLHIFRYFFVNERERERTGDTLICLIVRFCPLMLEEGSLAQHSASPLTLKLQKLKLQLQFQQNAHLSSHPPKKKIVYARMRRYFGYKTATKTLVLHLQVTWRIQRFAWHGMICLKREGDWDIFKCYKRF